MLPVIQIGPLALRTSGLLLLLGTYLGLILAERRLTRDSFTAHHLQTLVFVCFFSAVLGGRLVYIATHFSSFRSSPQDAFSLDTSLFDPFGAFAFGLIAMLIYTQRKKIPFWIALDGITPALAVLSIFLGLAHLASGKAYGTPTDLPWGIELWGTRRHPTQLYEILISFIILGILWKKPASPAPSGLLFLLYLILSASGTLLIDAWRVQSAPLLLGFHQAQVFAWCILVIGLLLTDRLLVAASGRQGMDG